MVASNPNGWPESFHVELCLPNIFSCPQAVAKISDKSGPLLPLMIYASYSVQSLRWLLRVQLSARDSISAHLKFAIAQSETRSIRTHGPHIPFISQATANHTHATLSEGGARIHATRKRSTLLTHALALCDMGCVYGE